MDCSPPGPSVHGIFQARVLEWVAIAFSDNGMLLSYKKKNTSESVLMKYMKLESITEREVNQKEKHQYSLLRNIYEI